eukprot:TRINITY_DN4186_c0_g1_i2.p1 TRINITY_DN4186_c0_g1~~TRINITY_DN4186_c0_g1_i2.p1  ORF type:complete len:304 (-),score=33.09 TRINITY_DN4186_c0_g1_i2:21-932(-)
MVSSQQQSASSLLATVYENGYVLLHSDSWKSKLFHRWFSSDLLSWSNETMVDAMPSSYDTALVWAPKAVFDEQTGDYVVLWCAADNSDLDRKRIWSCRTKDFVTWGPAAVLLDPGYTVIDGQIVRTSERFYLFFKDERITEKSIRIAMSDLIDSGYSNISDTITPYLTEGPFAIDMGKFWFLYCDNYPPWGHYDALQCDDLDQVAQQPGSASKLFHEFSQSDVDFPPDCRHGSVIPVTLQQADALLKKYPSPVPSPALQQHAPQLCSQITLSRRTVGAVFQAERRYAEPVPLQLDAKSSHVNM